MSYHARNVLGQAFRGVVTLKFLGSLTPAPGGSDLALQ